MSDTARPYPERRRSNEPLDVLVEGMALVLGDMLTELFRPLVARVARHRREQDERAALAAAAEALRLRKLDPIEFIRDTAARELAAGKAQIRRDFDRLYDQLGITRQETP